MPMKGSARYEDHVEVLSAFLLSNHASDLRSILLSPDPILHYPVVIDFAELSDYDPHLADLLHSRPADLLPTFDCAARLAQKKDLDGCSKGFEKGEAAGAKEFVHVRIIAAGIPWGLNFVKTTISNLLKAALHAMITKKLRYKKAHRFWVLVLYHAQFLSF